MRAPEENRRFFFGLEWRPLIATFLLSTVLGGALTAWYQYLASRRALQESQRETAIKGATDVYNDVSRALDKRLYRTRRLLWAYQAKHEAVVKLGANNGWDAEIASRRAAYLEAVQNWNENLNRTYALTELYFGRGVREYLEQYIANGFRCISEELREDAVDLRGLERRIDAFNPDIYYLNIELLRRIQKGDVGALGAADASAALHSRSSPCAVVSAKAAAK